MPGPLVNPLGKSCGVGAEVLYSDGLLKWLRYRPEHDVKLLTCMTCMIEQSDRVEVCERLGICTTLCYVVFTDLEGKIRDAVCIQNTALMPDT